MRRFHLDNIASDSRDRKGRPLAFRESGRGFQKQDLEMETVRLKNNTGVTGENMSFLYMKSQVEDKLARLGGKVLLNSVTLYPVLPQTLFIPTRRASELRL